MGIVINRIVSVIPRLHDEAGSTSARRALVMRS